MVKVLSTKEFIFEHARGKIASLELLDMPDSLTHPLDRLEYFASVLDFENTYMVCLRVCGVMVVIGMMGVMGVVDVVGVVMRWI